SDARREILRRVREGLPLVTKAEIHGQILSNFKVILNKKGPEDIVHRVACITEALGVVGDVFNIVEIRRTFAEGERAVAGVVRKLAEVNRAAKLLAIAAAMGIENIESETDAVASGIRGNRVVRFILMIQKHRGLRRARRESAAGSDGHHKL